MALKGVIRYDDLIFQLIETGPAKPFLRLDLDGKINFVDAVEASEDFSVLPLERENGRVYMLTMAGKQGNFVFDSADIATPADDAIVFEGVLPGRFKRLTPSNFYDARWFGNTDPWFVELADAFAMVQAAVRFEGLKIIVKVAGVMGEYWWKNGTADGDLISTALAGPVPDGSETKVEAGNSNITISGAGTVASPYKIAAKGDGGNIPDGSETKINNGVGISITGSGTLADPYVISAIAAGLGAGGSGGCGCSGVIQFKAGDADYPAIGASTYTNPLLPHKVLVIRNYIPQPQDDPGGGGSYITKPEDGAGKNTITFFPALSEDDLIQIILP